VERARVRFGRIDILVNNVGGTIWAKPFAGSISDMQNCPGDVLLFRQQPTLVGPDL
jgi:hypothetical protein